MNQRKPLQPMDPIVLKTLELCYKDNRSCRGIAERAGVSHMTMRNWRNSGGAQISTLAAVLGALGYRLKIERIAPQNNAQKPTRQTVVLTEPYTPTGGQAVGLTRERWAEALG